MTCALNSPGLLLKLGQEETPMELDKDEFTLKKTMPFADEEHEGSSTLSAPPSPTSV